MKKTRQEAELFRLIIKNAEAVEEKVREVRRRIHGNPELSGEERNTAALVAGALESIGVEVRKNVGGHGVMGIIRGEAGEGRTIALRADMDALPIQDVKQSDYASGVPGVMHACGHDVHTSVLLGTAKVLASIKERLKGNVKLIFQPSEEKSITGAKMMIKEGILEDPEPNVIVALHCYPELEAGVIAHKPGIMTAASDKFKVVVLGKSGHASRPHQCVDAVLLSALVINAIQHIVSRRTDPLHHAVISIGTIHGGSALNVIADRVEMEGTVRTLSRDARQKVRALVEETIKGVTEGMGGGYELEYEFGTPAVVNDAGVDGLIRRCGMHVVGEENVITMPDPKMGAEDFAYFTEKVPGALFRLGTSNKEKGLTAKLHSPDFDVDEKALDVGVKTLSWLSACYLLKGLPDVITYS
ncbi:MAG: M20 family metallopeptidase [Thermodesulfobacteriota bacterium]